MSIKTYIKTFFSSLDVAHILLCLLLLKILITSQVDIPQAIVVIGLMSFVGAKFYFSEVILRPEQTETKKELLELKSKFHKVENEMKQAQAQVKPPTQRIWG